MGASTPSQLGPFSVPPLSRWGRLTLTVEEPGTTGLFVGYPRPDASRMDAPLADYIRPKFMPKIHLDLETTSRNEEIVIYTTAGLIGAFILARAILGVSSDTPAVSQPALRALTTRREPRARSGTPSCTLGGEEKSLFCPLRGAAETGEPVS